MRSNQWLQDQLGSPTWRATTDHMISMGYEAHEVTLYNKRGVEFMCQFRDEHEHTYECCSHNFRLSARGHTKQKQNYPWRINLNQRHIVG